MYSKVTWTDYRKKIHRKRFLFAVLALVICGSFTAVSVYFTGRYSGGSRAERRELLQLWDSGSFEEVFSITKAALVSRPVDYFLLTMQGFSAYQLGVSQINNLNALQYFDECVWSLRKALLHKEAEKDGRLYYVLGKAYSYKGDSFADLSVKYLEKAKELSFNAADIPQYLGMAYALVGDYRSSVAAFTEALGAEGELGPSGPLLLSIARSYLALDEYDAARAYLQRCIAISPDSRVILSARLLLAEVLRKADDISGARMQLQLILDEMGENAEAHYQLGELYALQGETARARAEWRLALRADPAHIRARVRLSI
jgi:tetratricopeptide (TPR) repeat protein